MIVIPFIEKHILLEFMLSLFPLLLELTDRVLVLLHFLILVALVIPAGGAAMLAPAAHAEPAKLVLTHITRHVVAALVLLDRPLALGAVLGVGDHPRDVLALALVFHVPLHGQLAVARPVRILISLDAEDVPAFSLHFGERVGDVLDTVRAPRVRTPLHVLCVVGVRLAVELYVLVLVVPVQVPHPRRMRHCQRALEVRTS